MASLDAAQVPPSVRTEYMSQFEAFRKLTPK